jgi:alanyl-tRNA synthetase
MAEELGLHINEAEFEEAQALSKEASKGSTKKGSKSTVKLDVHDIATLEKSSYVSKTDDSSKFCTPLVLENYASLIGA